MGHKSKSKRRLTDSSATSSSSSPSSPSSSSDSDSDHSSRRRRRSHRHHSREKISTRKREKQKRREKEERRRRREKRRKRDEVTKKKRKRDFDDGDSECDGEEIGAELEPEVAVRDVLTEFPAVGSDLKQLLKMVDDGQAVDIKGISEITLAKHLKKLFHSLKLEQSSSGVFLLPPNARPTLELIGPLIKTHEEAKEKPRVAFASSSPADAESREIDDNKSPMPCPNNDATASKGRVIGPQMPSAELLAAAAKLTEAQAELKDAELEDDDVLFIGPPPPALVAETASANEAERIEEVTRIMTADVNCPYDVVGVNHNMSSNNIKKRYWKLSLLVHPDKCSHPQAHQAFILLNKAFKELQDPEKRKVLDDKIKEKEEKEQFQVELKAMREAAQWRKSQGISMEGDDELLAATETKVAPKRDEWMTTLPPERKPGMTMHSTQFSRNTKEGRGDTSAWTDTPSDRAQKAKTNYLEAYNQATALASKEDEKKGSNMDAELVDQYNKSKRSKSLVQKHQEEKASRSKKKCKQQGEKEEWVGNHPWKPWDRESDLVAGRQSVKLDSKNMAQGLTSRFASGNFQRSFL